jgi:hypothetical protein
VLYTHKLGVQPGTELRATQGGRRRGEIAVVWDEQGGRVKLRGEAVKGEFREEGAAEFDEEKETDVEASTVASGEMYV